MSRQSPPEKSESSLSAPQPRPRTPPPAYTPNASIFESTYPQATLPVAPTTSLTPHDPPPLPPTEVPPGPLTLTFSAPIIHPPPPSAALYLIPISLTSKGIPLRLKRLISVRNSPKQQERDLYECFHVPVLDCYTIRGLRARCLVAEAELKFALIGSSSLKFEIRMDASRTGGKAKRRVLTFDGTTYWYYPLQVGSGKDSEKVEVARIKSAGDDKAGEIEIVEGVEENVRDLVVLGWVVGVWKGGEQVRRNMEGSSRLGKLGRAWGGMYASTGSYNNLLR